MNKKTISLIAMIVSALIAVCGILVMTGVLGGNTYTAYGNYLYDSGYASFGGDFYTYVNNNAADAAEAAFTIASNVDAVAELLKNVCGISMIGFGLLNLCRYWMMWLEEKSICATTVTVDNTEVVAAAEETTEDAAQAT